jgi:nucleoside-diphosphate-sugar epimerase
MRLLPMLKDRYRVFALTSQAARVPELRAAGAVPVIGNLDHPSTHKRLRALADRVIYLAPPPPEGLLDMRSARLSAVLGQRGAIVPEGSFRPLPAGRRRIVYISTTGVYGDCGGAKMDETRRTNPGTPRALRRTAAERSWRALGRRAPHASVSILRVPGIYARDRLPLARLRQGTPTLVDADDVYTNHIEAGDLARITRLALHRGRPQRIYHASDDSELKMAQYFDAVADACALPRPARVTRAEAPAAIAPQMLSFMGESRRLANRRIKRELRAVLRYPTVESALADWCR